MQNLEWYLADLKSRGKNIIETVEKSLTDMFIRLVRIYPCLSDQITPSSTHTKRFSDFLGPPAESCFKFTPATVSDILKVINIIPSKK